MTLKYSPILEGKVTPGYSSGTCCLGCPLLFSLRNSRCVHQTLSPLGEGLGRKNSLQPSPLPLKRRPWSYSDSNSDSDGNSHLVNADPGLHSQQCFLELKNKLGPAGARGCSAFHLGALCLIFFKLSFTLKTNLGVSLFLCTIGIYRCYLCCLTFIKF